MSLSALGLVWALAGLGPSDGPQRLYLTPVPEIPAIVWNVGDGEAQTSRLLDVAAAVAEPHGFRIRSAEQAGIPASLVTGCPAQDFVRCLVRGVQQNSADPPPLLWMWTVAGPKHRLMVNASLIQVVEESEPYMMGWTPLDDGLASATEAWFGSEGAARHWKEWAPPDRSLRLTDLTQPATLRWDGAWVGQVNPPSAELVGVPDGPHVLELWVDGSPWLRRDIRDDQTEVQLSVPARPNRPPGPRWLRWVGAGLAGTGLTVGTVGWLSQTGDDTQRLCAGSRCVSRRSVRLGGSSDPTLTTGGERADGGLPVTPVAVGLVAAGASAAAADLFLDDLCGRRQALCLLGALGLGAGLGAAVAAASP